MWPFLAISLIFSLYKGDFEQTTPLHPHLESQTKIFLNLWDVPHNTKQKLAGAHPPKKNVDGIKILFRQHLEISVVETVCYKGLYVV